MARSPAPSTSRAAADAPAAPPSLLRRWAVRGGIALGLLLVAAWGLFTYLFYDPFEGPVGDLARVVPADSAFALRGTAADVAGSEFVRRRLLPFLEESMRSAREEEAKGPGAGPDLSRVPPFEEWPREIARMERQLDAGLPGPLKGFTVAGDLFGGETVVFGVPDFERPEASRTCVATRVSPRAKKILSVLKHEWARRRVEAESRLRITRYRDYYEIDTSAVIEGTPDTTRGYAALVRDVLVAGNDRALVQEAAHLALTGGAGSLPDRPDAGEALAPEEGTALRAFVDFGRLAAGGGTGGKPTVGDTLRAAGGLAGFAGLLLDPDALGSLRASVRFPGPAEAVLEVGGPRGEKSLTGIPEHLAAVPSREAKEALSEAAALAPVGSAAAVGRLELPAGVVLRALYGRADPEIRDPVDEGLRKAGSSMGQAAEELDQVLQPGVSVVLERLPDCDGLSLDRFGVDEKGRFVLPVPGVLLVFRQRPDAGEKAAENWFRKAKGRAEFRVFEDFPAPGGDPTVRCIRAVPKFLTGDLDLVRPAVAFQGDLVLVASNEGTLVRALEARAGKRASLLDDPGFAERAGAAGTGQGAVLVEMPVWRLHLRDQRREEATQACAHDWQRERKRVTVDVINRGRGVAITQEELDQQVEAEMERRMQRMRDFEFPEAMKRYLKGLDRLAGLRSLAAGLEWETSGVKVRVALRAADGGR